MKVTGHRIGWLDSCQQPSHIHRTANGGFSTICGHHPLMCPSWTVGHVPKKRNGRSNYCTHCFGHGGKNLPWIEL